MKGMLKMATDQDGAHFLQCPDKYWDEFMVAYQRTNTHPCPMPMGHMMFKRPLDYCNCHIWDVSEADMVAGCRQSNIDLD